MNINKIEHATNGVSSIITNPMYISYGLLGITSVILGYYTLFDNNIQEQTQSPVLEQPSPSTEPITIQEPSPSAEPVAAAVAAPSAEPVKNPFTLGGKKLKKTKKHKSKKH